MDDLHVDGELTAVVVEDKDANTATARVEGAGQAGIQVALLADGQVLLDVTGLGHGDDTAGLDVQDTVLLHDGTEHGLNDDAGGGVGDVGGLLVHLLGEDVDTEVTVLAGGGRGRDADDLAGAALEHQVVANVDVVARDGDGVGDVRGSGLARGSTAGRATRDLNVDVDVNVAAVMVDGVGKLVSQLVDALAEGVVVA